MEVLKFDFGLALLQWIQISHSLFLATRYTEGDELPSTFQGLDVAKFRQKQPKLLFLDEHNMRQP